jgi:hypothetical protein
MEVNQTQGSIPMITKAVRTKITLGDIELDVFQLPDGEYRYSQTQAFISIADEEYDTKQAAKRYIEICTSKKAQHLSVPTLQTYEKTKIEGENQVVKLISQADIMSFWAMAAFLGHTKALGLLMACGIEALERRADAAFGVIRDEEERNDRMAARQKGKLARRSMTDMIKYYIESHDVSDNYKGHVFHNCSDYLNKIILGVKAKQARDFYQISDKPPLRDYVSKNALRELELTEEMVARLIEERDMEPLEAVKQACVVCFTRSVGLE